MGFLEFQKVNNGRLKPNITVSLCLPPSIAPLIQLLPSGEVGFRALTESMAWAKRPMLQRVHLLPPSLPVTMLYGARSWVDSASGDRVAQIRKESHTTVLVSSRRGPHDIYVMFIEL